MLDDRRVLLLTDGHLGVFSAKTATCILRYKGDRVVALLDRKDAGRDPADIVGVGRGIPIVASVEEAMAYKPTCLLIGIAPVGGGLPAVWRTFLRDAITRGLDVVSGLHLMIGDDEEFGPLTREHGARIFDVRRPPDDVPIGANRARAMPVRRVLVIGVDCNVGKMVAAFELARALAARGRDARFVATGQTGIMLAGRGIAVDRVISDFVAGAVETMLDDHADAEVALIEGQGSLIEPAYSGVTLGLMHGAAPDAMILVCQPTRTTLTHHPEVPIPPLPELIDLHERIMQPLFPSKVIGIACNTVDMADGEARCAIEAVQLQTGLPAADVVRFDTGPLTDAIEAIL
ncbi:DUF1611 domain-containing protein [bacterium]|nr:DUF1611 domain-containing protein [bacterium]